MAMNERLKRTANLISEWPDGARYAAYYSDTDTLEFYSLLPHPEMARPEHWLPRAVWEEMVENKNPAVAAQHVTTRKILTKSENPNGLHRKYRISRADGRAIPDDAEFFVLRLDSKAERNHVNACRAAIRAYADRIEKHLPQLAADIRARYPVLDDDDDDEWSGIP